METTNAFPSQLHMSVVTSMRFSDIISQCCRLWLKSGKCNPTREVQPAKKAESDPEVEFEVYVAQWAVNAEVGERDGNTSTELTCWGCSLVSGAAPKCQTAVQTVSLYWWYFCRRTNAKSSITVGSALRFNECFILKITVAINCISHFNTFFN